MGENIEKFAAVMSSRMADTVGASYRQVLDIATVDKNMALVPDNFGQRIPKGSYLVNMMMTSDVYTLGSTHKHEDDGEHDGHESGDGKHTHEGGAHRHQLPEQFRGIKPKDRVLIAWCGSTPVVICIVA